MNDLVSKTRKLAGKMFAGAPAASRKADMTLAHAEIKTPPIFVVGTGRCGTHFLTAIMEGDDTFQSFHTDTLNVPAADSFARYALWYDLPIDLEPVRRYRHALIVEACNNGKVYFESNAYMSLLSSKLCDWFDARILLLTRKPEAVVNSHVRKGWYAHIPERRNNNLAPGLSPGWSPNHAFGRVMPRGEEYEKWLQLTQVGRVSWWVNALNMRVLEILETLHADAKRVVKVNELDYDKYLDLIEFANGKSPLDKASFDAIRSDRPGKGPAKRSVADWSKKEYEEFEVQTRPYRELMGYEMPEFGK